MLLAMTDLDKRVFGSLLWFFPLLAALIFIPAGTLDYWQAWVFLAVYIVSKESKKFPPKTSQSYRLRLINSLC